MLCIPSSFIRFITRITGSDKVVRTSHYYQWKRQYYHNRYRYLTTVAITRETFRQNQTTCAHGVKLYGPDDIDVVFVENNYDPDPTDGQYEMTAIYLIRDKGALRIETDRFALVSCQPCKVA